MSTNVRGDVEQLSGDGENYNLTGDSQVSYRFEKDPIISNINAR